MKIPIYCAFDKEVKVNDLTPNPRNPNKHPVSQIELLADIIRKTGWRAPITVSNLSGLIVKGHGRLQAAKLLGVDTVPVDFQDYDTEELELADLMADNRVAELSQMDNRKLLNLFEEFDTGFVDFEVSGYDEEFYRDLAHSFDEYEKKEDDEINEVEKNKIIVCPECGHEIEV